MMLRPLTPSVKRTKSLTSRYPSGISSRGRAKRFLMWRTGSGVLGADSHRLTMLRVRLKPSSQSVPAPPALESSKSAGSSWRIGSQESEGAWGLAVPTGGRIAGRSPLELTVASAAADVSSSPSSSSNQRMTSRISNGPSHTNEIRTGSSMLAARGQTASGASYSFTFSLIRDKDLTGAKTISTGLVYVASKPRLAKEPFSESPHCDSKLLALPPLKRQLTTCEEIPFRLCRRCATADTTVSCEARKFLAPSPGGGSAWRRTACTILL
mmetsp:Transcript_74173/g.197809  ORF Transcript_74173/g.197809 Transcript_74173/m.197809 type:complete len:268 (+) Transcript_74173:51-854(+)